MQHASAELHFEEEGGEWVPMGKTECQQVVEGFVVVKAGRKPVNVVETEARRQYRD
jgi:hypothetical protein